mmetsp:Transcript_39861/g.101121  ORF Transcript_39861/g.101121 Transcript_39861/m.101121 type:complete len:264 (-) Transcript_39861:291-1082(-)
MSASRVRAVASDLAPSAASHTFNARHSATSASSTFPAPSNTEASFSSAAATAGLSSPSTASRISIALHSSSAASPGRPPASAAAASISNASACCADASPFIVPVNKPTASAKAASSEEAPSSELWASRLRTASRALTSCARCTLDFMPAACRSSSDSADSSVPSTSASTSAATAANPFTGSAAVQRLTSLVLQLRSAFCGVATRRSRSVSSMAADISLSDTGEAWSGYICSYIWCFSAAAAMMALRLRSDGGGESGCTVVAVL